MKVRYFYQEEDFEGLGQMLIRQCGNEHISLSFKSTISYKTGYIHTAEHTMYALVSLADGMIKQFESLQDLCIYLNEDEVGYRPMTREEIVQVTGHIGNRFETSEEAQGE